MKKTYHSLRLSPGNGFAPASPPGVLMPPDFSTSLFLGVVWCHPAIKFLSLWQLELFNDSPCLLCCLPVLLVLRCGRIKKGPTFVLLQFDSKGKKFVGNGRFLLCSFPLNAHSCVGRYMKKVTQLNLSTLQFLVKIAPLRKKKIFFWKSDGSKRYVFFYYLQNFLQKLNDFYFMKVPVLKETRQNILNIKLFKQCIKKFLKMYM